MALGGECLTPGHWRKALGEKVKYQKQQSEFTGHQDHSSALSLQAFSNLCAREFPLLAGPWRTSIIFRAPFKCHLLQEALP